MRVCGLPWLPNNLHSNPADVGTDGFAPRRFGERRDQKICLRCKMGFSGSRRRRRGNDSVLQPLAVLNLGAPKANTWRTASPPHDDLLFSELYNRWETKAKQSLCIRKRLIKCQSWMALDKAHGFVHFESYGASGSNGCAAEFHADAAGELGV